MANNKIIAADDRFHLVPREIIQHIQSFLDESKAARTTLLSKSWYGAWSTRPNLVFSDGDCFSAFAKKTVQRYKDLNLKIVSLKLDMPKNRDLTLAKKLIVKAMKLGVVDLNINFLNRSFVLPGEVFRSKSLTRLSLRGFTVDLRKKVTCSQLKSLNLVGVIVKGDLFRDLILRCPLIEELTLNVTQSWCRSEDDRTINIRRHEFDNSKLRFDNKLKYLFLGGLDIKDSLSRHDFLAGFPCLKELVIVCDRYDYSDVKICSTSLERISIRLSPSKFLEAKFDVPNLRNFHFEGSPRSCFDLKTTSSDIHISFYQLCGVWLAGLIRLLTMSRLFKVSLIIDVMIPMEKNGDHRSRRARAAPAVVLPLLLFFLMLYFLFVDQRL